MTNNTKVIIFDIDGVIADYTAHYERFLEDVCGLKKVDFKRKSYSFYETYGISRQAEEKFNIDFIKSGGFREISLFNGVVDVMSKLKQDGYKIVLITARPSWLFKRLYDDTFYWLNKNNVPFDLLFWSKDKGDVIINNIFPASIICMIEDRDKHSIEVSHIGVDVLLLDKTYNRTIKDSEKIHRIYNYKDIIEFINNKEHLI